MDSHAAQSARLRPARLGGCLGCSVEVRPHGVTVLRSTEALQPGPDRLTDRLEHWAAAAPDRTFAAQRAADGQWVRIGYAQMLQRVRAVGQALAVRGLSAGRPVAILSDNDLEHLTLGLACQWVGVPYAPISPAYSLVSRDHGRLRHILGLLTPGLVFASQGAAFAAAIAATVAPGVEIVTTDGAPAGRPATPFQALLDSAPGAQAAAAHAGVGPDTIAKLLFTSGSTQAPKGVINTQRMLCANQQQLRQTLAFLADAPPVLVDWLPWNHTFGGNHNLGLVLYNGGTLYIDDGKPTPAGIAATLRNLREIAPTVYFNVPKGFEEIAHAMEADDALRVRFFSRVQAFFFAGAGMSQAVWDQVDRLAVRTLGQRVQMITGLGMTECAPACTFALDPQAVRSSHIGLPCPGVEVKLVPQDDGKIEIRFRGPNVTPGYWREPERSAQAFDDEGFYRTGDAARLVDPADPQQGLLFDGRIAEDFKLSTGTFVSAGPLRIQVLSAGAPCVQDLVVCGINRDEVGLLVVPRLDSCRQLAGLPPTAGAAEVAAHPAVRGFFQRLADRLWAAGTGSCNRVARLALLIDPPSVDKGEITDKGSLNQRAMLTHRAATVDALYDARPGHPEAIFPRKERSA